MLDESDYDTLDVEQEVVAPLRRILEQREAGVPLVWMGPKRLHHAVAATCPPPSWYFSKEGLAHCAEQDQDFWDVFILVAFHLGFHNGTLREEQNSRIWKRLATREPHA